MPSVDSAIPTFATHYFVLGHSQWFESLSPHMRAVRLDLDRFPLESASVTYPDSVVAMRCGTEFGLPDTFEPYHDQVFRLDEIPDLVAQYGLPDDRADEDYVGYEFRDFEKFIEIQLWTDTPIQRLLPPDGGAFGPWVDPSTRLDDGGDRTGP